jgi:uncharacterized protein (DUF1330 family)
MPPIMILCEPWETKSTTTLEAPGAKVVKTKELEKYWTGIQATMKGHPIEVLVAYGKHEVLEGDPIEGIVIAKFPNVKAAKDWYYSEAYQSVAKHRKDGAIYHGLIVEGVS